MIPTAEKKSMLKAHSIGPKMVDYLEQAGITGLAELSVRDAQSIHLQIEVETGVKLNKMGLAAIENLISFAKCEVNKSPEGRPTEDF